MNLPGVQAPSHIGHSRGKTRRYLPRLHNELLVCGLRGHVLVGLDSENIDGDALLAFQDEDGVRWHRCLRCDSWLPVPAPEHPSEQTLPPREEIHLPTRGRPLRDKLILRMIAVERSLHFFALLTIGIAILLFAEHRTELHDTVYQIMDVLNGGPVTSGHGSGIFRQVDDAFSFRSATLHWVGIIVIGYGIVEGIEAVGLWMGKRWAEYLTLLVTASFLPLEIYELSERISPFKVAALIVNILVVVYLLFAKRLFGVRGGRKAEQAVLAVDMGWEALERNRPANTLPAATPAE